MIALRITDIVSLSLKTFHRSPSLKHSIAFALLSLLYLCIFRSLALCTLFIFLATVFNLSLCAADRRVSTSLVRGLRICGARREVARASIYLITAFRSLTTCLPPSIACSLTSGCLVAALSVLIPLLASLVYEECSVVRRS